MDITERTPLIQPNSYPTINLRYIPRTWSKSLTIISTLDFIIHLLIYIFSILYEKQNDIIKINNHLRALKFYDYLILSSIRVSLLFSFCYVKKLIKFHIPVIITFFTFIYIAIDNYFNVLHNNNIFRFLLVDSSFIFSWAELIIYVIAIYKYGRNYWYRISNQSFQLTYENLNNSNQNDEYNSEEEQEEENNQGNQSGNVLIDIDDENSSTINNSFNRSGILQSSESALSSNKKHITIDSNYQFYSFLTANTFGNNNNNITNQYPYNNNFADTEKNIATTSKETKPIKIKHRVSRSIDIKRKKNDSDLYIPELKGEHNSTVKCNTLPNHLSLKSFSPFSPFLDDNQFLSKSKQGKSQSKGDISNVEKEKKKDKGKGKYIDKQLPIVMFENFKKDTTNDKKIEENERIQSIISEIELFYDDELKNMIWGNGIEEAEEKIRSDENFREKPYLLMSLVNIYIIKFIINGAIDFNYFLKILKTAEKSVLDLLTKKSRKLYNKSYSISSLYNAHNSDSLPVSENTSMSSIFSNATSFTNLADYDNDDDNNNSLLNDSKYSSQKDKLNYEYLFFKNCEIFYAEIVLIRGYIETVIGKEIRGVIHIRKAWKLYNIFQNESFMTRVGTTEKEQSILSSIKYSVIFGIGFTHMFSFLLNKNELQTINLTPNIDTGIKNLGEIIQLNEYKAPISVLLIFVKYIYFNKCKRALKVCQSIRDHFPNSIIFTYLFNTSLSSQHADTKSLFTCDPEKYIRFLGPFFNKKILNPMLNQKWEDTINNLKEYGNLVESKNLKLLKNNNYYEHIYILDKFIKIDTKSLLHENKLCIYCLFQPFVIPITKMEQNIYKWCCLKMLLFDYRKDLLTMKDKYKKEKEKEKEKGKGKEKDEEDEDNQNPTNDSSLPESSTSEPENHSSTSSIDIDESIESNPVYKEKKEKYKKLKEEFKIFNELFISQCKEYKKSKEISHEENNSMQNVLPCSICCQLDPIFLYIATNIDNKNNHSNSNVSSPILSESSSLIDIVCLLFAIHYASPSKMTDLLVKLFPILNSNSYNTLMNPPLHIDIQYIIKCLNSFNKG